MKYAYFFKGAKIQVSDWGFSMNTCRKLPISYGIIKSRGKDGGKGTNAYFVPGTVLVFYIPKLIYFMPKYYGIIIPFTGNAEK